MSSSGGGGGDSKDSANREMQSFDGSTAGTDTDASEERDDGESRKRKATEPPTEADEAAATATLLSMPQNISKANSKKENNVSGDMSSSRDNRSFGSSDHDLSTIEGQQALNPNMSIDQARFQVRWLCVSLFLSLFSFLLCLSLYFLCCFIVLLVPSTSHVNLLVVALCFRPNESTIA